MRKPPWRTISCVCGRSPRLKTSRAPSLILPSALAANIVTSSSLANVPAGVCVNFITDPSTSIASAIASFLPAPLNGAANAERVKPLIAIGLSSASRSSGEVRAGVSDAAAFFAAVGAL